jgi:hypothetical protein
MKEKQIKITENMGKAVVMTFVRLGEIFPLLGKCGSWDEYSIVCRTRHKGGETAKNSELRWGQRPAQSDSSNKYGI